MGLIGDCTPKGIDIEKGTRQVMDAVMNGKAFKNPVGGDIGDLVGGMPSSVPDEIDPSGSMTETLQGINAMLGDFQSHSNKLSGKGDVAEFSKIIGIAGAFNSDKESMQNKKQDNFSQMFEGITKSKDDLTTAKGLMSQITTAINNGDSDGNLGNLINQAQQTATNLNNIRNSDNANFDKAFSYVVKKGLGSGVSSMTSPDGDCFAKTFIENNIASPALKKAINTQNLPQKIHDKLPDVIDVDMDQIMEGVTGDGTQGAAHAEAAQGAAAAIETRFKTIESSLGLTSDVTHDHLIKIDGGSYGIVI
jgi:hypothetical protein